MDDKNSDQQTNKTPQELQADIASTRDRISQDIDELSDRVSPGRFKEQAQETLTGAQDAVMSAVSDVSHTVGARAKEASSGFIDMLKSHPVPAALIGLGVGLLAAGGATVVGSGSRSGSSSDYGDLSSNDKLVGAKALPRAGYSQSYGQSYGAETYAEQSYGGQNYDRSGNQGQGIAAWIEDHPLAVGAVTMLIGAAIGLSVPGTRYENEVMGEASDLSIERAKGAVGDAVDVVKESASQATKAVKDEIRDRGVSKESLKDGVKAAAETVSSEVKDAAKNVVDTTKQKAEEAAQKKAENSNDA